jgi:HEPN domain-containing protein
MGTDFKGIRHSTATAPCDITVPIVALVEISMTAEQSAFDIESVVQYWLIEAEEALDVADHLVEKGDYSYALFFGHLAIEKLLKALYTQRHQEHAPPIHNLLRLANAAGAEPDERQTEALIAITAFNIESRYPDVKRSFRTKCTPAFTARQMETIREVFAWQRSLIA